MKCESFLEKVCDRLDSAQDTEELLEAASALTASPCFARAHLEHLDLHRLPTPVLAFLVREAVRQGVYPEGLECTVDLLERRARRAKTEEPLPEGALPEKPGQIPAFFRLEAERLAARGLPPGYLDRWVRSLFQVNPAPLVPLIRDLAKRFLNKADQEAAFLLDLALKARPEIPEEEVDLWLEVALDSRLPDDFPFYHVQIRCLLASQHPWTAPLMAEEGRHFHLDRVPTEYALEALRKNPSLAGYNAGRADSQAIITAFREGDQKWREAFQASLTKRFKLIPHFEEEREALTCFYRDFLQEVPPEALKPTHVFLLAVLPLPENVLLNVWRAVLRDLDPRKDLYGPGAMPDFRVLVR